MTGESFVSPVPFRYAFMILSVLPERSWEASQIFSFFEGGLNFYFQRESAVANPHLPRELNNGFNLRILLFIPFIIINFIYFTLTGNAYVYTSIIISIAVFLFSINNLFNAVLFGKNEYRNSFIYLLFSRSILILIFITAFFSKVNTQYIASIFALSGLVHCILLIRDLRKRDIHINIAWIEFPIIRRIFISALPMGIGMIMVWVYDRIDVVIIQDFLGNANVAIYAVAYSLFKLPQSFANFLLTPLFSEFSSIYMLKGYLPAKLVTNKVLILITFIVPIIFIVYYLSTFIIPFLYGDSYISSVPLLKLLIFCLPGLLLNNFTGTTLNSCRKERAVTISVFWAATVNIVLNIVLIPLIGLMGAVIASIITEYFTFMYQFIYIVSYDLLKPEHHESV